MNKEFDDCIYLHFLDRELRGSLGLNGEIVDSEIKIWIKTALFMTNMPLYVSLSHMYESYFELSQTINFLFKLEKNDLVLMVSSHINPDEFLESKKNLYSFDKKRYKQYFINDRLIWPKRIHVDKKGTTKYLKESLLSAEDVSFERVLDSIKNSIIVNKNDAITIQRFLPIIKEIAPENNFYWAKTMTQVMISRFYTKRYLDVCHGTIITGLPRFEIYDELAKNQVYTNYRLYSLLIGTISGFWEDDNSFIEFLFSEQFKYLKAIIQSIVELANMLYDKGESINKIIALIKEWNSTRSSCDIPKSLLFLQDRFKKICKERGIEMKKKTYTFLIMVATSLELDILLKELKKSYPVEPTIAEFSYLITSINGNTVYIVKSQMGAGGPGGSILTTNEAIKHLEPDAVIMYGIAWGAKDNQKIGDVLVSNQVWEYDPCKVNEDNSISRGSIIPASSQLIQAFELINTEELQIRIFFGLIASGSKLLNNKSEVGLLKDKQPELIGGDMEIAGVASSCERSNTKWIMIKGICDWGFNKETEKKEEHQKTAASNAAKIIIKMLKMYNN